MCGTMSSRGTDMGNLSSVGSRTVKTGMDRSRLDGWCSSSVNTSLALSMAVMDMRNRLHSMMMPVKPVIFIPARYQWTVRGHNSCVRPIR